MTQLMIFGLYLLKHAVMAHVVDVGYSRSRLPNRNWWWSLMLYACCEVIISAVILNRFSLSAAGPMLIIEFVGLLLAGIYERRAFVHQMLRRHFLAELLIIVMYLVLAYKLSSPTN